ncbi:aldo/keto reductase [Streptomyces sp. CL12-4]|uniref:aldo/keto reductase n=1 Tax=Streptomyces sp. CL12-4 TaxID=2810306 RepID=UPI0027E22096|nr:aldo/keto reductase [Streptomyces sp. CL12-4]
MTPLPPPQGSGSARQCRCRRRRGGSLCHYPLRRGPAQQDASQGAEDNGMTLIEMALAFALNHPAVASVLMGPRTLQHLDTQLPAADVTPYAQVLDRIDEIVAPGTVINPADTSYINPALEPVARRR